MQVLLLAKGLHKMYRKNHRNDPGLCLCWFWTTSSNKKTNSLYHKFIRWYKKKYFVHSYSFSFVKLVPLADKKLWEIPTTDSYLLQFRDWTPLASEHVCLIIFMRSWFFFYFSVSLPLELILDYLGTRDTTAIFLRHLHFTWPRRKNRRGSRSRGNMQIAKYKFRAIHSRRQMWRVDAIYG